MIYITLLLANIIGLTSVYVLKKFNLTRKAIYYAYQTGLYLSLPTVLLFILNYHFPTSIIIGFSAISLWLVILVAFLLVILLMDIDEYKDTKPKK